MQVCLLNIIPEDLTLYINEPIRVLDPLSEDDRPVCLSVVRMCVTLVYLLC